MDKVKIKKKTENDKKKDSRTALDEKCRSVGPRHE